MIKRLGIVGLSLCLPNLTLLADSPQIPTQFEYPELLVTPRASETLAELAQNEHRGDGLDFLTIQLPALLNMTAGYRLSHESFPVYEDPEKVDNAHSAGNAAMVIGGGWLVTTIALETFYKPYVKGWLEVRKLPAGSKRETLIRERRAEQVLRETARYGRQLTHLAAWSNLVAGLAVMGNSETPNTSMQGALAAVGGLSPFLFRLPWIKNYRLHRRYKKQIYGPIATTSITVHPVHHQLGQMMSLNWYF
jgi:hypothetical protein